MNYTTASPPKPNLNQTHDKTSLRDKVDFDIWLEDGRCSERLGLSQRIHFSSPMTILRRNGSIRNLTSNEVFVEDLY